MTIRDSGIATGLAWTSAVFAAGFAIAVALVAGRLTSPQWISLMTVPGGKYFWVATFGVSAAIMTAGLVGDDYRLRGSGFALMSFGCSGIAMFYLVAPVFHAGPVTLGYWPWFVPAGIGVIGAITNWWPIEWF